MLCGDGHMLELFELIFASVCMVCKLGLTSSGDINKEFYQSVDIRDSNSGT